VTGLLSKAIAPVSASALPFSDAPVPSVMDALAIMVPTNTELVPRVPELPSTQKTL